MNIADIEPGGTYYMSAERAHVRVLYRGRDFFGAVAIKVRRLDNDVELSAYPDELEVAA